jgi:CheY-like chemotaxis protein
MPSGGELQFVTAVVDRVDAENAGLQGAVIADAYLEIRVSDTGIGMDEKTVKQIFEPFFTTKGQGEGTGMGLAAVHGTANAHNGAITVESEPGHGTTFSLYLPLSDNDAVSTTSIQSLPVLEGSGRILIVEDEAAVRDIVRLHLTGLGYQVETAKDGMEGIALFRKRSGDFDLVLLDLILPRLDGASVFTSLVAQNPHIKVLLLTGHSGDIAVHELIDRGALDIIRKPFSLVELSRAVAKALV